MPYTTSDFVSAIDHIAGADPIPIHLDPLLSALASRLQQDDALPIKESISRIARNYYEEKEFVQAGYTLYVLHLSTKNTKKIPGILSNATVMFGSDLQLHISNLKSYACRNDSQHDWDLLSQLVRLCLCDIHYMMADKIIPHETKCDRACLDDHANFIFWLKCNATVRKQRVDDRLLKSCIRDFAIIAEAIGTYLLQNPSNALESTRRTSAPTYPDLKNYMKNIRGFRRHTMWDDVKANGDRLIQQAVARSITPPPETVSQDADDQVDHRSLEILLTPPKGTAPSSDDEAGTTTPSRSCGS